VILKKKMLSYVVKSTLCLMLVMSMAEASDEDFDEKESKQNSGTLQLVAFSAASKERVTKRQYDDISLEELPYLPRQVLGVLSEIENGTLVVELPTLGQQLTFQGSKMHEESAVISISDLASFASRVAARGEKVSESPICWENGALLILERP